MNIQLFIYVINWY